MKPDNFQSQYTISSVSVSRLGTLTQRQFTANTISLRSTNRKKKNKKKETYLSFFVVVSTSRAIRLNLKLLHICVYNQVYQIVCQTADFNSKLKYCSLVWLCAKKKRIHWNGILNYKKTYRVNYSNIRPESQSHTHTQTQTQKFNLRTIRVEL